MAPAGAGVRRRGIPKKFFELLLLHQLRASGPSPPPIHDRRGQQDRYYADAMKRWQRAVQHRTSSSTLGTREHWDRAAGQQAERETLGPRSPAPTFVNCLQVAAHAGCRPKAPAKRLSRELVGFDEGDEMQGEANFSLQHP
jgi:hypothetical protein